MKPPKIPKYDPLIKLSNVVPDSYPMGILINKRFRILRRVMRRKWKIKRILGL